MAVGVAPSSAAAGGANGGMPSIVDSIIDCFLSVVKSPQLEAVLYAATGCTCTQASLKAVLDDVSYQF